MSEEHAVEYWHYATAGNPTGPVARADLVKLLTSGALPLATPVWRAGFSDWQPAAAAFALADPRAAIPWLRVIALATLAIMAVALSTSQLFILDRLLDIGTPDQVSGLWAAIVALAIIVGGIAVSVLWQQAPLLAGANPASALPGTARATAVLIAVVVGTFAIFGFAGIPRLNAVTLARTAYGNYTIAYDAKSATLRIDGVIGTRFAAKLEQALDAHEVRRIDITSEGGLIAEAMAAARAIEPRKIEIVVRESCNSACLIVLAAGAKRYAHVRATFGFHAAAPIIASEADLVADEAKESDEYIVARGAPRDMVDEANRLGAETMRMALSVELMQRRFIDNVYDGDDVALALPPEIARWRAVEFVLENEYWPVAENLRAIREAAPNQVTRHAGELDLPTSYDLMPAALVAHSIVVSLRRDAVQAASDETVAHYAGIYQRAIDAMINEEDWENCAGFVGDPASTDGIISPIRFELANALGRMVKSAEDRDWAESKMPADALDAYSRLKADADLAVLMEQEGDEDRNACLHAAKLAQGINALGSAKAIEMFRYADRYDVLSK